MAAQADAAAALSSPSPQLVDENLRGFILLLSAHFQGFCRDLYTECAQAISTTVPAHLQFIVQEQFLEARKLDVGNPNLENLRRDFERFGFVLDLESATPGNAARITHLGLLNRWRNIAAHHGAVPPGGSPDLAVVRAWESSCDVLAVSLDGLMYNRLLIILGRPPWTP